MYFPSAYCFNTTGLNRKKMLIYSKNERKKKREALCSVVYSSSTYVVKSSVREERKKREGELAVIRSLVIIGARVLLLLAYSTSRQPLRTPQPCLWALVDY